MYVNYILNKYLFCYIIDIIKIDPIDCLRSMSVSQAIETAQFCALHKSFIAC